MDRLAHSRSLLVCGAISLFVALPLIVIAWLAAHSNSISFLPAKNGAEWVVYPSPAEGARQRAVPVTTTFRREIRLEQRPATATTQVRAFKNAELTVNGQPVKLASSEAQNWKAIRTAEITALLSPGTNEILVHVTNSSGPPALWLQFKTDGESFGTDESWEASLAGAAWQRARLASRPPTAGVESPFFETENLGASLRKVWPLLAVFCLIAMALVALQKHVLSGRLQNSQTSREGTRPATASRYMHALLAIVLLLRLILFIHDAPLLPRSMGFDASAHEDYVRFIQERHALPLATDGWEMYQPPFYYVLGAALLDGAGCSTGDPSSAFLLKAINCCVGLAGCWLTLLCLARVFPKNYEVQAIGLLLAAFLPPNLYLSQFITNELLMSVLVTGAFYGFLRSLDTSGYLWPALTGLGLGAAMLSKFSALLAIPLLAGGIALHVILKKESGSRSWVGIGILLFSCFVVCGWQYIRVWASTGSPFMANWETGWWQTPGLRTAGYYLQAGHALVRPLFSGLHSFSDGLYSTLWADGMAGGAARVVFRPPWNYELMTVAGALAVPLTLIVIFGTALVATRLVAKIDVRWLVTLGFLLLYGLATLYMSLKVPSYAEVKSFYASPAATPFILVFAAGWLWLAQRHRAMQIILWLLLLTWCMTTYSAFWVRPQRPQVSLVHGMFLSDHGKDAEAFESLQHALDRDAAAGLSTLERAEAHFQLALVLERQGNMREAINEYRKALATWPTFPAAANNLAWLMVSSPDTQLRNGSEAVTLAELACRLTQDQITTYIGTLAAAYAEAGNSPKAIATAQRAIECATLRNEPEIAEANRQLLEHYRAGKAYGK